MEPTQKKARGRPSLPRDQVIDAEQVRLPLPAGSKARISAALAEGESMGAFIRAAIEREIARRGG